MALFRRIRERFRGKTEENRAIRNIEIPEPSNAREVYFAGDTKIAITDKYEVLEPPVPENFNSMLEEVIMEYSELEEGEEEEKLMRAFLEVVARRKIPPEEARIHWYHLRNTCLRFGKISALFQDEFVEDISCSGPDMPVFVYHRKYGYMPTNISFQREELRRLIHSLAQKSGFILSFDNPIIDATLPDGSRINIALSVAKEPSFAVRKIKSVPISPKTLIEMGTWPSELAALSWLAMENRCSIMFVGGTAAGKTTAMNATAFFIPLNNKIVSIEDTYEIVLPHKNWTALIVRGNMTTHDLLKATLRQRPEYIIIGEARGLEVREMFSAMGVGHTVLTTFHGANAQSVAKRLFGDPFQIKSDQFQLLDFILTMSLTSERKRKCTELILIGEGEERLIADVFGTKIYSIENGTRNINLRPAFERIAEKGMKSVEEIETEFRRKKEIISKLPAEFNQFIATLQNIQRGGMTP